MEKPGILRALKEQVLGLNLRHVHDYVVDDDNENTAIIAQEN